jgi:hypothetical protein
MLSPVPRLSLCSAHRACVGPLPDIVQQTNNRIDVQTIVEFFTGVKHVAAQHVSGETCFISANFSRRQMLATAAAFCYIVQQFNFIWMSRTLDATRLRCR